MSSLGDKNAEIRPPETPRIQHFIGRRSQLEALRAAYTALLQEQPVSVYVRGRSGMGKSALIHHFLMGLRHREGAVVLRGRCLERDAMPFNAFASLSGALSRYLRRLSAAELQTVLPRDIHALARLFPVLQQVPAVAEATRPVVVTVPSQPPPSQRAPMSQRVPTSQRVPSSQRGLPDDPPDAQELRLRGFAAMRQLLWRLAERRPLIVSIEDLQWSDVDSVALLLELVRPPAAPSMLFLGSYRSEEVAQSAPLHTLLDQQGLLALDASTDGQQGAPPEPACDLREVEVGPLDPAEAEELALALLFARDPGSRARADAIARLSEGNPRLIGDLVRSLQAEPGGGAGAGEALGEALRARLARIPEQALRLLEVVAVAGGPISPAVAMHAAKLRREEQAAALVLLRTEDLVSARRIGDDATVETFHDDIREAIVARLDAERRKQCHRRLARALEAAGRADPEALSLHWMGAGDTAKAGSFAVLAADQAADALAFERAARLYKRALTLRAGDQELAIKCGDALVNAGESAEAARVYSAAAEAAEPALGLELRRCAAEQYLRSGHIDEGLELLRTVLRAVGLSLPETPRRALLSLLLHRAELRVRGLRFQERSAEVVRPEDLARIDACWSATVGLSAVDLIRSADFSVRALLLALRAGEPYRVARALAFEASSACMMGSGNRARAEELVTMVRALAERVDISHVQGLSMMVSGMLEAFAGGRWREASGWYEKAEEVFRDRCAGVAWEVVTTQLMASWMRFYRGQIDALARTLPGVLRGAEQRGDRYAVAILSAPAAWVALAGDDPSGARRAIARAMSRWSQSGFHLEHFVALLAETYVDRYAGRPGAAWKRMQERWRPLEGSLILRLQNNRIMAHMERGSTALAAAEDVVVHGAARAGAVKEVEPLVQVVLRDAAAIAKERLPWSDPYAVLLRAGAAAVRGEKAEALELLDVAAAEFDAAEMPLYAAAARRRAGELHGGEKGLSLLLVADAFMARENIKSPARWAAMMAPGFGRR